MSIPNNKTYNCAIVGGGLAGLCLSIQLAKRGYSVVLLEKKTYPFNKVCGEYISMESWSFLESIGLSLSQMNLPIIRNLNITNQNGFTISSILEMGGFGISRYTLDNKLAEIARECGVSVLENCTASVIKAFNGGYEIQTTQGKQYAEIVCGSYGKINSSVVKEVKKKSKGNYIGVKYHIKAHLPENTISLHNFKDGYCGVSKVDDEKYCVCYLTTRENLNNNNNDIKQLEENVLMKNPYLKELFTHSEFIYSQPLVISQISFDKRNTHHNGVLLLGDAAGCIAPLCGNGMSMAMQSSKILTKHLSRFFENLISKDEMISQYSKEWNNLFSFRIKSGYYLQKFFGKKIINLLILKTLKMSPKLFKKLISLTHGQGY